MNKPSNNPGNNPAQEKSTEYLFSEITMDLTWNTDVGETMTGFFKRLKTERCLYGMRCSECQRVYLPPRPVCGDCWLEMNEWVALGNQGTIVGKTVCHYKILDSLTGEPRKTPFVLGLIQIDGAHTTLNHFVEAPDPALVSIGDRVEIVFRDALQGNVGDIVHFQWLGPQAKPGQRDE